MKKNLKIASASRGQQADINTNFKKTIFLPMILLTTLGSVVVLISSIAMFKNEINSAVIEKNNVAENVVRYELKTLRTQAHVAVLAIKNTEDLKTAILNNDRAGVLRIANELKSVAQIDYTTILDAEGNVIARTHALERYGDNLSYLSHVRLTFEGKTEARIIKSPTIPLGISAGIPIMDNDNEIIGAVTMGFRLDNPELVQRLRALTGCEITFFRDDINISSTMYFEDGSPLIGTKLSPHVSEIVLSGETYVNRRLLFGRDMLAKYFPLYDEKEEVAGVVFVGNYVEEYDRKIEAFILNGLLIMLAALIICLIIAGIVSVIIERRFGALIETLKQKDRLLSSVLNSIDAMIYATVPDTGEILFINDLMKENYGVKDDVKDLICYKIFQKGLDDICPFCPCHELDKDPTKTVVWEENSPLTKRIYRNTDRYIKWIDGRTVHLQHSVDITEIIESRQLMYESELAKNRAEAVKETIMQSINYASRIQKNLIPKMGMFHKAFADYSVIWKPRDIVGGDIYWIANFDCGTILCVCDCTGHGTPGALLTMLVVSVFEMVITEERHNDTAEILYKLDKRLSTVLNVNNNDMEINDGCDLAVLFIAKDGGIKMSAGNTNLFVCDGEKVIRHKGQAIFIGEGKLKSKDEVEVVSIPANPNNKFYIATDGLFDQIGDKQAKQFGYKTLEQIILENHDEKLTVISDKIWNAFEEHRGEEAQRDDVQLITFKPKTEEDDNE
ncbi:MAG: cache domain-containing protein [Chitinivibrionia bacterium]|nr:cache domain-containing protein [Chitinivibrionia bacterium]